MDAYHQFILCSFLIAWSVWGVIMWGDIGHLAPSWEWTLFLYLSSGPVMWVLIPYRTFREWRIKVLKHMKLPICGCCGDHDHDCRPK